MHTTCSPAGPRSARHTTCSVMIPGSIGRNCARVSMLSEAKPTERSSGCARRSGTECRTPCLLARRLFRSDSQHDCLHQIHVRTEADMGRLRKRTPVNRYPGRALGTQTLLLAGRRREAENLRRVDLEQQVQFGLGEPFPAQRLCKPRQTIGVKLGIRLPRVARHERPFNT
jgi:hypothetical protein